MNPRKAREIIIDTAWSFAEPQDKPESRPHVLYKYICFDWLVQKAMYPLLIAIESVSESDKEELLPQGAMLLTQLMEMQPYLLRADGKVGEEQQKWRDGSIELIDNLMNVFLEDWKLDRFFKPDGSVKKVQQKN